MRNIFIIFSLLLLLTSCGGNSGDTVVISVDPSGEWRVDYIPLVDECELLSVDDTSFVDSESVSFDGTTIDLSSVELPLEEYSGAFRSDDSFTVQAELTGDIFGLGFNCTIAEAIAYNNLKSDSAETVYEVKIFCDDGSRCDTLVRGTARRED